jgi:hypothetical protein
MIAQQQPQDHPDREFRALVRVRLISPNHARAVARGISPNHSRVVDRRIGLNHSRAVDRRLTANHARAVAASA